MIRRHKTIILRPGSRRVSRAKLIRATSNGGVSSKPIAGRTHSFLKRKPTESVYETPHFAG
jgi:hypothetical protein